MSKTPLSLTNWGFGSTQKQKHLLAWSPSGIIAYCSGRILTIYISIDNSFKPALGMDVFGDKIIVCEWCQGISEIGETPPYLYLASKNGRSTIIDAISRKTVISSTMSEGYITAAKWDPINPRLIYIASSNGNIAAMDMETEKLNWITNIKFKVNFLSISPHDNNFILAASKKGKFCVLRNGRMVGESKSFPSSICPIVTCHFNPYSDNLAVFATRYNIFYYRFQEEAPCQVFSTEASQEQILSVFHPNNDESNLLIVFNGYAQLLNLKINHLIQSQYLKYLMPQRERERLTQIAIAYGIHDDKLAIMTTGNDLQVFQMRNGKYWAVSVTRGIPSSPSDFDVQFDSLLMSSNSGIITTNKMFSGDKSDITEYSCDLSRYYHIPDFSINRIAWLSDHTFVVLLHNKDRRRALFINFLTREVISLLKPSIEILNVDTPLDLVLSPSRKYFVIIAAKTIIQFFENNIDSVRCFKTLIEQSETFATFCSKKDEEFWTITINWRAIKYQIDSKSEDGVISTRMKTFDQVRGQPTGCIEMIGFFVVGTSTGALISLDWSGTTPKILEIFKKSSVKSIEQSPANPCNFFMIDAEKFNAQFHVTTRATEYKINGFNIENLKWMSDTKVIMQFGFAFAVYEVPQRKVITIPFATIYKPHIKLYEKRLSELQYGGKIDEFISKAKLLGFSFIGNVLAALTHELQPSQFGLNYTKEQVVTRNRTLGFLYSISPLNKFPNIRARYSIYQNNKDEAFQFLITTPPDSPDFTLNILKASFIKNSDNGTASQLIETLLKGEKYEDAIDLMVFTGKYLEAVKQMISMDQIDSAALLAKSLLKGTDYNESIKLITNRLLEKELYVQAALVMITNRDIHGAAELFRRKNITIISTILNNICTEDEICVRPFNYVPPSRRHSI